MLDFINGDFDVLLSTTIVESGLDIPNVNTIVINNADHFGLSQLYQLRGRVGRSNLQAYSYLMTPREKILSETARKRLSILQELTYQRARFISIQVQQIPKADLLPVTCLAFCTSNYPN